MFLEHFGFTRRPFTREMPTEALLAMPPFEELAVRLQYMVTSRAFGLVTGEVGSGKTTALRALYDQLDKVRHRFIYIADSSLNPRAFYRDVLDQLDLPVPYHSREMKRQFEQAILTAYQQEGKQTVIVLDEAHLLSAKMLQEVRFILNFHLDAAAPLTFILVGQAELRGMLRLKSFEAIVQRVQMRYHLAGLDQEGVAAYIEHHLRYAGATRPIFAEQAVQAIATLTRGLPRMINNLAAACLLDACSRGQALVDEATVQRAAAELQETTGLAAVGSPW
ncbi:MAG: AAA family ATPase [Candidatus Desulforudis sp.]|nr:AAA family ATPase [Desulforudis sp.]